ncbi:MAG: hypothetical protein RL653_3179 [Pseudomonadota bacterium]
MALDDWEHAFHLQYGPAWADCLEASWNWNDIQSRFDKAQSVGLVLKGSAA